MIFFQSEATAARRRFWLYLVDATDGITPETGEAAGQPQISKNGAAFGNTTATLTAVGNGTYYVELTAAELDTLGKVFVRYKSANTAEFSQPADVVAVNVFDSVRAGLTALPNAAAEAAGGLFTRGTGAGQINQSANGQIDVNAERLNNVAQSLLDLKDFADDGYDPATNKVQGVVLVDTVTTYTGNTPQTGDAFARLGAPNAGSVSADIAVLQADTDDIQARIPATLSGGRMRSDAEAISGSAPAADAVEANIGNLDATVSSRLATAGYTAPPTVAAIADGMWDEAIAGHLGAGSTGAALNAAGSAGDPWTTPLPGAYGSGTAGFIVGTNLDATVASRASQTSVNTIDDFLDTEVAAILADTNELQTDWANGGRLDNILDARASQTSVDDLPTNAELATALAAADDAVLAAIAALNNLSAAQVNAEVLDVLATDVQTEITAIPAAATTLLNMIKTVYAYTTNEARETSSLQTLRNRANSATIGTHAVTDDGTTYTRGSAS